MAASRADQERLAALVETGANRAASALEQLAGCQLATRSPRLGHAAAPTEVGPWEIGLLVEVEGELAGVVGLLLTPATRDVLVKTLLGAGEETSEWGESALRELGNIVASQAVSAMANRLGQRLLPSVPILASRNAEGALAALIRRRGAAPDAARFESLLQDPAAGLCALLVFAPDEMSRAPTFDRSRRV